MTVSPQPLDLEHPIGSDEASFAPGHMLGGQYKILGLLGSGGMGSVFKVQHVFWDKNFALKVLNMQRIFDDVQMRRFQLEAKATDSLDHPNLVKVHDFGVLDSNQPYLVMEYVEGETIADKIMRTGPMSIEEAAPLFAQVCFGLLYAHESSIVHRDIKSSNIMLVAGQPLGAEGSVRILDFGIAKLASRDGIDAMQLTRTGEVIGSPIYMSPEQCAGTQVDNRSDIYSLGCVIFEALTGKPPFTGINALRTMMMHQMEPVPTLKEASGGKSFPREIENVVSKMLQKSPSDRYKNLGLVAHDLGFIAQQKTGSKPIAIATKTVTKVEKAPPKMVTMSLPHIASILSGVALTTVLATSAALCVAHKSEMDRNALAVQQAKIVAPPEEYDGGRPPNFVQIVEEQEVSPEKLAAYRTLLDKSGPVRAYIAKRYDHFEQERRFTFPRNCTFGYVSNALVAGPDIKVCDEHIAQGQVATLVVPNSVQILGLDARRFPTAMLVPNTLDKIDPNLFWGLFITDIYGSGNDKQAELLAHKLQTASKWTKLKCVKLYETPLSEPVVKQLATLKHLERLTIGHPTLNNLSLMPKEFWHQLKELVLVKVPSGDIPTKLTGSPNIERLLIEDSALTPHEIEALGTCKNLNFLQLTEDVLTEDRLKSLCNLHNLEGVYLQRVKLEPHQIKELLACKNLTLIELSNASSEVWNMNNFHDDRVHFRKDTGFL